ncbi:MAG: O-antigen ligase family protein [Candidatus Paceibacterota bacterium]
MTIQTILRRILIVGIFATLLIPFIVDSSLYFPFITGKAFTFRILTEVMFIVWIALTLFDPSARPKKSCILWSSISFMVIVLIANLQGTNPDYSFWSNYERMEGYVTLAHLFGYFLVISSVFNTKKIWDIFLNSFVGITVVQSFYSILQITGVLKVGLSADRIDGTFGNATYLAAYMMFGVFVAFYLLTKGSSYAKAKYFYISAIVLQVVTVFFTATRGTFIAVIGGLFLAILILAILEPKKKFLRWSVGGALIAIVLFVSLVFGFKESNLVQQTVPLQRLSEISLDSGTVLARVINWGISWSAIKEKPLLGYGQGNYGIIFDNNYDSRMWNQEQWFDRVHNLFFDWLIAAGFLGLLSYLSIIGSTLYYLWKSSSNFSNATKASFTALFAAYFVHVMFVFDSLTSYLILFFIFAFIHSQVAKPIPSLEKISFPRNVTIAIASLVLISTPFVAWAINSNGYFQNTEMMKAIRPATVEEVSVSRDLFEKSLARNTYGNQEVLMQLIDFTSRIIRTDNVSMEVKQSFVDLSAVEIQKYINENPTDSRTMLIAGQFLAQTGNLETSLKFFDSAINISPQKQFMYQPVVEILFQQGKNTEALELIKRVYEINTDNTLVWGTYVRSAIRSGDEALYNSLIEEAFATGRGDRVIYLSEYNLERNPESAQAHASLAVAHYRAGNPERAIEILNDIILKFPQSKTQSELIIEKIKAGEEVF